MPIYSSVFRLRNQSVTKNSPSFALIISVRQIKSSPFILTTDISVSLTVIFAMLFHFYVCHNSFSS